MNNITPLPWHYEKADSGDRTVGIDPYPPYIYAEQSIAPEYSEIVEIAYLNNEPAYLLGREFWSEEEKALDGTPEAQYADFPLGTRMSGSGHENGRRIVAAINSTKEWSTEELEQMSFPDAFQMLYLEIEALKHTILEYEINFKERGDIWDTGVYDKDENKS